MICKQAYVIKYETKNDKSHEIHVDESDLTINLCMGKKFEGGNLVTDPKKYDQPDFQFVAEKKILFEEFLTLEQRKNANNSYSHKQKPGYLLIHSGKI